ncbi:MAG: hypothetical protein LBB49_00880 [Gracilibacteraceae bacterium]|nr:hypothetical protein [Gracilibacteraceae bacterium]
MTIWINSNKAWSTQSGIFECIVEETRSLFKDSEQRYVREIYKPLDDYQQFIELGGADDEGFNLFYKYCKQAMDEFPDSERGKIPDKEYLPVILGQWSGVLRIMSEDPRYRG